MGLRDRESKSPSQRWADTLNDLSDSTRITYSRELDEFLAWAPETPESLVKYWVEIRDDPKKNMGLSDNIKDYLKKLDEDGYTGGKQTSALNAIKRFFKSQGFKPVIDIKVETRGYGGRAAKKDEIKQILAYGVMNPRDQAIVAISKDSALRVSDIVRIQFKHIQPLIDNPPAEWLCFKIDIRKTKSKKRKGLPCLGPDGVKYLRKWLDEREGLGLTSEPDDYVFTNIRELDAYETSDDGLRAASTIGAQMRDRNASMAVSELCARAGLSELSANSLRKFNTTALTMAGMGSDRVKIMQGKHQKSSIDDYLDAQLEEMLKVYQQFYDYLSLESDAERELAELKAKQTGTNGEVSQLRQELEAMKNTLAQLYAAAAPPGLPTPTEPTAEAYQHQADVYRILSTAEARGRPLNYDQAERLLEEKGSVQEVRKYLKK